LIVYVNGDSHSAGCDAVHPASFLGDDNKYTNLLKNNKIWKDEIYWSPHPDNLKVSYGQRLSDALNATLHCHARSASSNDRILRTTYQYLQEFKPDLIIIGWSTWEREEWFDEDEGIWYQVNGSGIDLIPNKWHERYKKYVNGSLQNPAWNNKVITLHNKMWQLHLYLNELRIPHLFFNTYNTLKVLAHENLVTIPDWKHNYLDPYSNFSFFSYLVSQGCKHNKSNHFGPDAHKKWTEFLLPHVKKLL